MKLLLSVFLLLPLTDLLTANVVPFAGNCPQFFLRGQPPTAPTGPQYRQICQVRTSAAGYEYATLYDPTNRIPVYSAYEFQQNGHCTRATPWYIEPQLDDQNGGAEMNTESSVNPDLRGQHQALNGDYYGTDYDRGHLVPVRHRNTQACSEATFTLTNAAPQYFSFNRGQWSRQEGKVSTDLTNNCLGKHFHAYIVTGVVPGNTISPLKGRVNVPALFWSAYCCVDNNDRPQYSGSYYGVNDRTNKVTTDTVANLNAKLTAAYGTAFSVFGNFC